ncbi:MAG TPA: leucine-rich repeat domain-containing protein, partial [Legionellaceae bacterium]|nr:leucine-rich repeat domain-containing protein [Legionellaceae bacterium]
GKLSKLHDLKLNNNLLNGNIPSQLGNLSNLSELYLYNNRLSGSIPPALGNMKNLTTAYLYNNQLSGSIPPELGDMKNLRVLYLYNNQLTGNIPQELGNLSKLGYLDLANNQLTGSIPAKLGNLANLGYLDLANNQLSGTIPSGLFKLYKYQADLYLDHNQLSGKIPSEFGKVYFFIFHLDNNQLNGKTPDFISLGDGRFYIQNNRFVFGDIMTNAKDNNTVYAPQANIPIHKNGNTLSVYTGGSYQLMYDTFKWYKGSMLVATITGDSTFTPSHGGNYSVTVTNSVATALTLYSDTVYYNAGNNAIASKMNDHSSIAVYPNPAKTNTNLSFNAEGKYSMTITDMAGNILQTKTGVANKGANSIQLDVNNYASGMYLITITDEKNRKQTLRLNKE